MADCALLATCIFFNDKMSNMPFLADVYKRKYCKEGFEECARYRVYKALGRGRVPADLLPNQPDLAQRIMEQAGRSRT